MGRYFDNRADLVALCRSYVDELFPRARVVHVIRNPVQVAASHLSMEWALDAFGYAGG